MGQFRTVFAAAAISIIFCITGRSGADERPEVKILERWRGELPIELRKHAAEISYIADEKTWARLWKGLLDSDYPPEVDFKECLVILAVGSDPNEIAVTATLDEKGDLRVSQISTARGFFNPATFRYQFARIERPGIKTIDGKPFQAD